MTVKKEKIMTGKKKIKKCVGKIIIMFIYKALSIKGPINAI